MSNNLSIRCPSCRKRALLVPLTSKSAWTPTWAHRCECGVSFVSLIAEDWSHREVATEPDVPVRQRWWAEADKPAQAKKLTALAGAC